VVLIFKKPLHFFKNLVLLRQADVWVPPSPRHLLFNDDESIELGTIQRIGYEFIPFWLRCWFRKAKPALSIGTAIFKG